MGEVGLAGAGAAGLGAPDEHGAHGSGGARSGATLSGNIMALQSLSPPSINRLRAQIGEIRGRSRPITAHNDKDGLVPRCRRHARRGYH